MRRGLVAVTLLVGVAVSLPVPAASQAPSVPECFGREATIVGTQEGDDINGTEGRDVIVTLGGDDQVDGDPPAEPEGGPRLQDVDFICLGAGEDYACGGGFPGRGIDCSYEQGFLLPDRLSGGPGPDRLLGLMAWGGPGADVVSPSTFGGGDGHRLHGGRGPDELYGTTNCAEEREDGEPCRDGDLLSGGRGSDWLGPSEGRDRLLGGRHDDELRGGIDGDELFGGPGQDACFGGTGRDRLVGCEPKG